MSYHLAMYPVHFEVVLGGLYLKNVFQMGGGGLRGKKFMFSQEASNFSFFNLTYLLPSLQLRHTEFTVGDLIKGVYF